LELTVLGTSAAWPTAEAAATGMLVRHEGFHLVVDLGTGAFANLQRWIPHERIDAIAISHRHLDHCLDLYPLFLARTLGPGTLPPVPLVSPPGVIGRIAALEDEDGARQLRETFEVREIRPGEVFEAGPFHVETALTPHPVPTMAMRIGAGDRTLAYTGDTGPNLWPGNDRDVAREQAAEAFGGGLTVAEDHLRVELT
jgi:ribonuclease BN (tRNA processing enzyme)